MKKNLGGLNRIKRERFDKSLKALDSALTNCESGELCRTSALKLFKAVKKLRINYEKLEKSIIERNAELAETNNNLIREITERKKAEDEMRLAKEKAEEAVRLEDQFVCIVVQDLRAPLLSILDCMDLLLKDETHPLSLRQREVIEKAKAGGGWMLDYINQQDKRF